MLMGVNVMKCWADDESLTVDNHEFFMMVKNLFNKRMIWFFNAEKTQSWVLIVFVLSRDPLLQQVTWTQYYEICWNWWHWIWCHVNDHVNTQWRLQQQNNRLQYHDMKMCFKHDVKWTTVLPSKDGCDDQITNCNEDVLGFWCHMNDNVTIQRWFWPPNYKLQYCDTTICWKMLSYEWQCYHPKRTMTTKLQTAIL